MVDPRVMCRAHLLGEHRELHALAGMLRHGISLQGYFDNHLLELPSLEDRHTALVKEMLRRGYSHHSPFYVSQRLIDAQPRQPPVNREWSLRELFRRCPNCKARRNL